jgi:hypothetical protein
MNTDTPRTDAEEAKLRAEWLHAHNAPKDWVILREHEVAAIKRELAEAKARDEFNWNIIKGCMEELEMKDMGPSMIRGEIQEWKCSHERLKAKEVAATDRAVLLALERDTLRAEVEELKRLANGWTVDADDCARMHKAAIALRYACKNNLPPACYAMVDAECQAIDAARNP